MEEHDIREENAVLRQRIVNAEQKMKQLVEALEKRNDQIKEWSRMFSDLQKQLYEAQESANTQASIVQERNKMIQQLSQMIDELRQQNYIQSNMNLKEAEELREDIKKQKLHLVDTLNHLLQAKIPAEEAFRELGEMLDKKSNQIDELKNNFEKLSTKYEQLNHDLENKDEEIRQLNRENFEMDQDIKVLKIQLADARSERRELAQIEQLNIEIEKLRQKLRKFDNDKTRLKKVGNKLRDDLKDRDSIIEQLQDNLNGVIEKNLDMRNRYTDLQTKNYNLQQKMSKMHDAEKQFNNKFQTKKAKAHMYKMQLKEAQEKISQFNQKKSKIAVNRMRKMHDEEDEVLKQKEMKIRLRQEIEKRLDAEQEVFNMKDEMEAIRAEIAKVKREYAELKGTDVEPLIDLLRDLQIEAITINNDYEELIESIPAEPSINEMGIPENFCESPLATKVLAQASQYFIENKELRVLLHKFARHASIYKRISNVIAKYPILSMEDIGTQEERGTWVLTADIEHLQRCVVKLHELLIRKKNL
ncbi:hypothetical protein TRFO_13482 [Tritrichomonas foetus]|uniref:Uncharacterized protein n=1 Tax=Tritrichomonas foetus TaxID=1144522 RepID=A0A1J4L2F7_9EUKA|nr:hypothetical protein TRFO_13482 [Tritrichomonas foetus]|eukprot:OHT16148.1 hypothetical protein TRFO_13482 [Tritrichomonas foetus]